MTMHRPTRRHFTALMGAGLCLPRAAHAEFREISWDDLIPPGVPYAEIIAEGEMDYLKDTWKPVYDQNASALNTDLDGAQVKLPGYVLPLEIDAEGLSEFVLVPYVGACIHVPPPPPNQLVFVTTPEPWPAREMWSAIWVFGTLHAQAKSTELAEIGYTLKAEKMTIFEW